MTLRKPILAGNWKLHHGPTEAERFFGEFLSALPTRDDRSVVIFPPAVSLAAARSAVQGRADIQLGVQNAFWEEKGAFTGEISCGMAMDAGATVALVGHSERRQVFGETSEETARKVRAALHVGLVPMLCVGETLEEREAGRAAQVVEAQLAAVFDGLPEGDAERVVIAYEPVWAIGTGRTASPGDAEEMHGSIRRLLSAWYGDEVAERMAILYGGSVKPDNAEALLAAGDVDGVLVGGASLDPAGFARICEASS